MKMPNFASLYQSGVSYLRRDSQLARKGPSWSLLSTSWRIAPRGPSYLLLAFCQAWSMRAGSCDEVGAVWSCACIDGDKRNVNTIAPTTVGAKRKPNKLARAMFSFRPTHATEIRIFLNFDGFSLHERKASGASRKGTTRL